MVMGIPIRVLIVEDSEDDAQLLVRELRRGGYDPTHERVDTPQAMNAALDGGTWDIVFSDYTMPHFSGTAALALLRERGLDLPFIFLSGTIGEDTAVAAMKAGAHDYIMKGSLKRLVPAVDRELREAEVRLERRQADEMIRYLAYHDGLTNLPNRTLLLDRLQQAILAGQREKKSVAFLLMDLDRFKEINDTLGHHRGDLLLQQVGKRIRDMLRESDTIARLGGDEFAMLFPGTSMKGALLAAQKILESLESPFVIEGITINMEASIGAATFPEHGANADTLMQRADVAMYMAKQTGSGYAVYDPRFDLHSPRRLALMGELRSAIQDGQLFLYYQPKIDLRTRRMMGVEALVRWQHPEHGFIPPDQFIAPAERTGLIKPLTFFVLNAALQQWKNWHQAGWEIPIAVNLSARNLQDPQLQDQITEMLETYDVVSGFLGLEITESVIMADPTHAMETLKYFSQLGISRSIDDFGTGYSSLGYLKKLPVDEIKIDRSFVMDMAVDEDDAVIVRSTIDLAHNLGLSVVAEGVENQETWDRLAALGCDAAQGYHISRPMPSEELTRWLGESPYGSK
jgi:diguanylate cyclase (GGDEF)-like protein